MRRVIFAICATAAALVAILSFKSHSQVPVTAAAAPAGAAPSADTGPANAAATAQPAATPATTGATGASTGAASPAAKAAGAAKTVTGAAWPTIYGPVQVKITVQGGKVTQATAVVYPEETPRDYQINSYAIPQLNSEAVAASSAKIDTVSGATYTSGGYIGSLQSALDKAGL